MSTNTDRKLRVFLCHSSQDKPIVRELYQRLNAEGWIEPWFDKEKILPGQDWRTEIEKAVDNSDIVIICLSNKSVDKEGFIQKELRYAREIALEKPEDTIFLVPLRLELCLVPRGLRFFQWVDFFGEHKEENFLGLLESFNIRQQQIIRREKEKKDWEVREHGALFEQEAVVVEHKDDVHRDSGPELMITTIVGFLAIVLCFLSTCIFPMILMVQGSSILGMLIGLVFSIIYALFLAVMGRVLQMGSAIIFILFGNQIAEWAFGVLMLLFYLMNVPTTSLVVNKPALLFFLQWTGIIVHSIWNIAFISAFVSRFINSLITGKLKRNST